MNDDHIVEFAHDFSKIRGQRSGFLCWVNEIVVDENFPKEAYDHDTDGVYPLEPGHYLQLVFLGDKEIPFTTYRNPTQKNKDKYIGKVGQVFDFKILTGDN